jgi:SEC-C motif-containing protein
VIKHGHTQRVQASCLIETADLVGIRGCDNAGVADRLWPLTAEALMRSRFEAFRDADVEWLLASWHPSTRPAVIDLESNPRWRGLQIVDVIDGKADDVTGVVEFRATCVAARGGVRVLHERSRFVREGGRWYYLDAQVTGGYR